MEQSLLNYDEIVEKAYEAAVIPEMWPDLLQTISTSVDAVGGILFVANGDEIRWTGSAGVIELMHEFLAGGWDKRNSRAARLAAMNYPGFVHDLDVFTVEELDRDPFYTELCRPLGLGWSTGTQIRVPNGDMMVFSFDRSFHLGPFGKVHTNFLDGLRPHLARSGLLATRLNLERARSSAQTMAALGLPAAILQSNGQVIVANELFNEMAHHVQIGAFEHLQPVDRTVSEQLTNRLHQLAAGISGGSFSIALHSSEHGNAVMHLIPFRRAARDIFDSASAIVIVTPVAAPLPPAETLLNGLFDLTPAEAHVAQGLASGITLRQLGKNLGVGYETLRGHLKSILAKTGTHRQADLISLLAGVSVSKPIFLRKDSNL